MENRPAALGTAIVFMAAIAFASMPAIAGSYSVSVTNADFSERPEEALFEMSAQKNCVHPLVNTQGKNADSSGNIRATVVNNPCAVGYPCVRFRLR